MFQKIHTKPKGHSGMNKTYERMIFFVICPGMKQEIENFIKKCETCQKTNTTQS
jgi:hypothetical protein